MSFQIFTSHSDASSLSVKKNVNDLLTQMRDQSQTSGSLGNIPHSISGSGDLALSGGSILNSHGRQKSNKDSGVQSNSNGNATNGGLKHRDSFNKNGTNKYTTPAGGGATAKIPSSVSCNSALNQSSNNASVTKSTNSVSNLTSLCADISPSSSHFFEVLYVGKIKVSHKRVPDTFIDEALSKFRAHEAEKSKLLARRNSQAGQLSAIRRGSQDSTTSEIGSTENVSGSQNSIAISSPLTPVEPIQNNGNPVVDKESITAINNGPENGKEQSPEHEFIVKVNNPLKIEESLEKRKEELKDVTVKSIEIIENVANDVELRNKADKMMLQRGQSHQILPTRTEPIIRRDRSASIGSIQLPHSLNATNPTDQNRTMVFQVGRTDLRLISPDRKQILLHKYLKDVSGCVQGIKNPEHFGFICREANLDCNYISYVFKCQSETVTEDVVAAISQAFMASVDLYKAKERASLQIFSCEHCPMTWYHKLCQDLEGLNDKKTQQTIFRKLEQWTPDDQGILLAKYNGAGNVKEQGLSDQNSFLMTLIRMHCEAKQQRHIHDTAENRSEFLNQYLGGSTIFMKAKRSLSNSFDHLLKRKGSKDDFSASIKEFNLMREANQISPTIDENCETTNENQNGISRSQNGSVKHRPRASTIGSTYSKTPPRDRDLVLNVGGANNELTPEKNQQLQLKSPMMDIFMKVGNTPKESPTKQNSDSWRHAMFQKVTTPRKRIASHTDLNVLEASYTTDPEEPYRKKTKEELRALWKKAINQAVLLTRMEKENANLQARLEEHEVKRIKLEYDEIINCSRNSCSTWDAKIGNDSKILNKFDHQMLVQAVKDGVPKTKRGEIWTFLADQHCLTIPSIDLNKYPNYNTPYHNLLQQLTSHQHAILIDLGRTFPSHKYYSSPLGPGQLSLFNILKAYSLLDPEVGYCQGLSFVAGVLLLHVEESEAFYLLRHLMFRREMRDKYLPDMTNLQLQLYQLSRLLRDKIPELYEKFNEFDICPTLYAAPWILTVFSSQFPLGFVTRVFDLLFLESSEVIFRVAISLLDINKKQLLACETFEEIMDYLRKILPDINSVSMEKILKQVFNMDISKQLSEYAVEYQVLQEQVHSVGQQTDLINKLERNNSELERTNKQLQLQNQQLRDQLDLLLSNVERMESIRSQNLNSTSRLESQNKTLEVSVHTLGKFITNLIDQRRDIQLPGEVRRIVQQVHVAEQRKSDLKLNLGMLDNKIRNQLSKTIINNQTGNFDSRIKENSLPLKAVDEKLEYFENDEPPKSNNKVSSFFANSFDHIRQHKLNMTPNDHKTFDKNPDDKIFSGSDSDSGVGTPQTPLEYKSPDDNKTIEKSCKMEHEIFKKSSVETPGPSTRPEEVEVSSNHPLSNCVDVNITYNGTTKLKTIRPLRANLSRSSSQDLGTDGTIGRS